MGLELKRESDQRTETGFLFGVSVFRGVRLRFWLANFLRPTHADVPREVRRGGETQPHTPVQGVARRLCTVVGTLVNRRDPLSPYAEFQSIGKTYSRSNSVRVSTRPLAPPNISASSSNPCGTSPCTLLLCLSCEP